MALVRYQAQDKTDDVELVGGGNRRAIFIPIDTDDDYEDLGFSNLFRGFRDHVSSLFDNFPPIPRPSFPSFGSANFPSIDFPKIDLSEANTTSTRKIINGHEVIVNETTFEKPGTYFKVSIIDVKRDRKGDDGETTIPDTTVPDVATKVVPESPTRDVEPIEDSGENEIPKTKETSDYYKYNFDNIETFDEYPKENRPFWGELEPFEPFDNNFIDRRQPLNFRDLSRDTYVNDLLAASGAPVNPDAEFVENFDKESQRFPRRQQR